mgnify:FL=1
MKEKINHPKHYNEGTIEVIDAIVDWDLNFCMGNVIKYVARHKYKESPLSDLKKARWYLDYEIRRLEEKQQDLANHEKLQNSLSIFNKGLHVEKG